MDEELERILKAVGLVLSRGADGVRVKSREEVPPLKTRCMDSNLRCMCWFSGSLHQGGEKRGG